MKFGLLNALFLHLALLLSACHSSSGSYDETRLTEKLQNGDIIFHASQTNQSEAIRLATHSPYTHMGIIYINDGEVFVYEAIQTVQLTPVKTFIERGRDNHFVVKRLKNAGEVLTEETLSAMREVGDHFRGNPYDYQFSWSDARTYCSELVWKIYERATGIEIGQLRELSDFDLSSKEVQRKMKERYGDNIPKDEPVIAPSDMFDSEKLITVLVFN